MSAFNSDRRRTILAAGGLSLVAIAAVRAAGQQKEAEVTANEDLMREHGVIRRALIVYAEAARRARRDVKAIPFPSLLETAQLFRRFAEDYHERALEEAHIFPLVRKLKSPVAELPDVLVAQHRRGREITDYILKVAARGGLSAAEAESFPATLESFVAMYEPHTAREDTVIFPAWKAALGEKRYDEMGDRFEDIERKMFGHDGFEDAVKRITQIETAFKLSDLSSVTAPPPPAT